MPQEMTLEEAIARQMSLKKELEYLDEIIIGQVSNLLLKHLKKRKEMSTGAIRDNSSCWAGRIIGQSVIGTAIIRLSGANKIKIDTQHVARPNWDYEDISHGKG